MDKKILMAFDDPGGGLALTSLIEPLKNEGIKIKLYSGLLSRKFTGDYESEILGSNIDKQTAEKILEENEPDMLITGTSAGNAEQLLRNDAFEKNITSVVILDFWKDYGRRWYFADYNIEETKDYVFVMDECTKAEMEKEGFREKFLLVTGHPYLDKIFNYGNNKPVVHGRENHYLFLSQPLNVIGIKNYAIHPLEYLLNSLKTLTAEKGNIKLTVKLHPVETITTELENAVQKFHSEVLSIRIIKNEISIDNLIDESEIVIGFNTIAMFEARAKNKRTISLKAVKVKESLDKAMMRAGIEIVEINTKDITSVLKNKTELHIPQNFHKGAIENCKREILNLLGRKN